MKILGDDDFALFWNKIRYFMWYYVVNLLSYY